MINRRQAIKRIGGLAGLAAMPKFLSACSDDGNSGPVGITNYVYLMLENRTYDHMFGARSMLEGKPGNGLTSAMTQPDLNGTPTPLFEPTSVINDMCVGHDPDHEWVGSRKEWNNGANDGFLRRHQEHFGTGANEVIQYQTRKQQPISWALADAYTTCDQWHASILGPTLPNRFYWHAATSCMFISNAVLSNVQNLSVPTIYHRLKDKNVEWAYYYGSLPVVAALGNFKGEYALSSDYIGPRVRRFGDSETTMGQFFTDALAGTLPPVTYIDPFFYLNDDHPPAHPLLAQLLIASIYTALAKSPQWKNIMFVITYDEHGGFFDHVSPPKATDDTAEKFAAPLAATGATQSGAVATFTTADQHYLEAGAQVIVKGVAVDGYNGTWTIDSVPDANTFTATLTATGLAPSGGGTYAIAGFDQLGFRVPAMVIGPYAKQGYVSSVLYNHASALKHLGNAFGLEDLNPRMATANDLTDCIDMDRLMRGDPAPPVKLPKITVNNDSDGNRVSITVGNDVFPWDANACQLQNTSLRPLDPISQTADTHPEVFDGYEDLRPHAEQYLASIENFLHEHQ